MYTETSFTIPPLTGLSEKSIEEHKKLYAGYVKNANAVQEKIVAYKGDETKTYEMGELYRRFSFEYNGMRNHECYFALLTGRHDLSPDSALATAIANKWGSIADFTESLRALASSTRGIGWAMLSYDKTADNLLLHWVDEQHLGQLQGTTAIIALDMWEHSYVADYQPSGKGQYVADVIAQMNWSAAEAFYANAK